MGRNIGTAGSSRITTGSSQRPSFRTTGILPSIKPSKRQEDEARRIGSSSRGFEKGIKLLKSGCIPKEAFEGKPFQVPICTAYEQAIKERELQWLAAVFKKFDIDNSGDVTPQEFARCMHDPTIVKIFNKRLGMQPHESSRLFRAMDESGDGSITISEWCEVCRALMDMASEGQELQNWDIRSIRQQIKKRDHGSTPRRAAADTQYTPRRLPANLGW